VPATASAVEASLAGEAPPQVASPAREALTEPGSAPVRVS
jgi:hypothetical protein